MSGAPVADQYDVLRRFRRGGQQAGRDADERVPGRCFPRRPAAQAAELAVRFANALGVEQRKIHGRELRARGVVFHGLTGSAVAHEAEAHAVLIAIERSARARDSFVGRIPNLAVVHAGRAVEQQQHDGRLAEGARRTRDARFPGSCNAAGRDRTGYAACEASRAARARGDAG